MNKLYVTENGKIRSSDDVDLADKIIDLRQNKDPWRVIDQLVQVWLKKSPEEVEAAMIDIRDQREMLTDKKYGTTKDGKDFERRFTIIFPTNLMLMIRTQFKAEELPFDRPFYQEFAKRYPAFKVAEKV